MDNIWHITPIDDLEIHIQEVFWKGERIVSTCSCLPHIEQSEKGIIILHHSFDGKEPFWCKQENKINYKKC